ncbi:uncharacterized protein LOC130994010 [Salvia miltiorrhiza]|uniref:uncharacterized protein LOC130994010 n=1 Tax=Salvia miltiorrhiza TaxID=226208 RepID=UPI0025ACC182|nr:uncharacterized protein LOC130994010 [Salvia miltiorrhiza]
MPLHAYTISSQRPSSMILDAVVGERWSDIMDAEAAALREDNPLNTKVVFSSDQAVVLEVEIPGFSFFAAFVHASCNYISRRLLWEDLAGYAAGSLVIIGDFNALLGAHERRGRRNPSAISCREFWDFIDDNMLFQPVSSGPIFTWTDRRRFPYTTESVLDRVLISASFSDYWENINYRVLPRVGSDHSPIILSCSFSQIHAQKHFRFLNMWCSHSGFLDLVKHSWSLEIDVRCPMVRVMRKLKRLRKDLKTWNKETFGNFNVALSGLYEQLTSLQTVIGVSGYTEDLFDQEIQLEASINTMLSRQASLIQQQSRIKWLSDGDRNTKFFQNMVRMRRSRLNIKQLRIGDSLIDDHTIMADHVVQFYVDLFTDSIPDMDRSWIGRHVPTLVTQNQGESLICCPSEDEIRATVFSMNCNGAPGPDSFSGKFFQVTWDIICSDVISAVQRFFMRHYLPKGLNSNFLTLLPKKDDAMSISDYRPIVLFGFVAGRSIHEGILLASEGVNCMNRSRKGNNMDLKVDIKKAFDTLNWEFVDVVLMAFGFPTVFRNWIQTIFASVRISVMFNGVVHGYFACSRGVRQGDPLSPILFGLAEDLLSRLLLHAVDNGFISQMQMSRQLSFPSHLLWKGLQLSMAGRVCLVASVIQSTAVHSMLIYQWPAKLLHDLDKACRSFIWTGCITSKARSSVAWNRVCAPKVRGGLGVKSFSDINNSFMFRLGWQILKERTLGFNLFRRRYLSPLLRPSSRWFSSSIWLSVRKPLQQIVQDTFCIIGRRDSISFWHDNWLGYKLSSRLRIPSYMAHFLTHKVSDFYFDDVWHLTDSFLEAFPEVAFDIISLPTGDIGDDRAWVHSRFGNISAALAFDHFAPSFPSVDWGKWIWAPFIPVRRSITCCRIILGRLPTMDALQRCGFIGPNICSLCLNAEENIDHLFWGCNFAKHLWDFLFSWFEMEVPIFHDIGSFIIFAMNYSATAQVTSLWRVGVITILWGFWNSRNHLIFQNVAASPHAIIKLLKISFLEAATNFKLGSMANSVLELGILRRLGVAGNPRPAPVNIDVGWSLPSPSWLKANIDGSIRGNPTVMHAGGVVRNAFNSVVACFHFSAGAGFAFEAELFTFIIILERAAVHQWYNLWIESDSTYVVNVFNNREVPVPWRFRSRWHAALKGVEQFNISCSHNYREGNRVADYLASSLSQEGFWLHSIPEIAQLFVLGCLFGAWWEPGGLGGDGTAGTSEVSSPQFPPHHVSFLFSFLFSLYLDGWLEHSLLGLMQDVVQDMVEDVLLVGALHQPPSSIGSYGGINAYVAVMQLTSSRGEQKSNRH